jgi:[ribosomal protein S5]-alanine N-acetyltransferase
VNYIIQTPRLYLREICDADAPAMYEMNLDPIIKKYTGDDPFKSVQATINFFAKYDHYKKYGHGRWAVVLKSTKETIGWCGLKNNGEYIDLGYRLMARHRDLGYATEAAKACLEYGFKVLNMNEICGSAHTENKESINVLQKLGMDIWKKDKCNEIQQAVYYRINKNQYLNLTTQNT